jgi:hypothetical protein
VIKDSPASGACVGKVRDRVEIGSMHPGGKRVKGTCSSASGRILWRNRFEKLAYHGRLISAKEAFEKPSILRLVIGRLTELWSKYKKRRTLIRGRYEV